MILSDPTILPNVRDVRSIITTHPFKHYRNRPTDKITHIAVHHSLTKSGSAEIFARYHVSHLNWPGIGYHFVIEQNGLVKWCNDFTKKSYHVGNSNAHSLGICLTGDFRDSEPTAAQQKALQRLLTWLVDEFNISFDHIQGHNEFPGYAWKYCPCMNMVQIRNKTRWPNRERNETPKQKWPEKQGVSLGWIMNKMKSNGYKVFDKDHQPYNINLVGIRSSSRQANAFDDHLTCFYRYEGKWNFHVFKATTDPGLYYLNHPLNVHGTAILKAGQYRGAYRLGYHRCKYLSLKQVKPVTVIRDGDRDANLDLKNGKERTGMFGINIHRATQWGESPLVNRWSAGCQVLASSQDFTSLIDLCKKARSYWGDGFTYTLLEV